MNYVLGLLLLLCLPIGADARVLMHDSFDQSSSGLVTNEYAYWNPTDALAARSERWQANSGSLFWQEGRAWTGIPDSCTPNRTSNPCTNSAVFRLFTYQQDFGDVRVSVDMKPEQFVFTDRTPVVDWDGFHLWLRYQSEDHLYMLYTDRRDGKVMIKKKCPGGSTNGGTYYTLAGRSNASLPLNSWHTVGASVENRSDGVWIELQHAGVTILQVLDSGLGCAPIRAAGAVGMRGDNLQFTVDNFHVTTWDITDPDTAWTQDPSAGQPLEFISTEPGSFECQLDESAWTPCSSPYQLPTSEGSHKIKVRALDAAGNHDITPLQYNWTHPIPEPVPAPEPPPEATPAPTESTPNPVGDEAPIVSPPVEQPVVSPRIQIYANRRVLRQGETLRIRIQGSVKSVRAIKVSRSLRRLQTAHAYAWRAPSVLARRYAFRLQITLSNNQNISRTIILKRINRQSLQVVGVSVKR